MPGYPTEDSCDAKQEVSCVVIDFSQAFDTVPQSKLLLGLRAYCITGHIHAWLIHFLSARSMRVALEGQILHEVPVESGVSHKELSLGLCSSFVILTTFQSGCFQTIASCTVRIADSETTSSYNRP